MYEEDNDEYIDCDPFSKLKFDDLRKVHKDQTIFAVSENDINNVKTYNSVDHLKNDRYQQNLNPLEKTESEKIIELRRKEQEEIIRNKQFNNTLKSMENEKKNQNILSSFLRLTN